MNRTVQEALAAGLKLPSIKALTEIRKNLASKKEYVMSEVSKAFLKAQSNSVQYAHLIS